jgi:hypothetical protein
VSTTVKTLKTSVRLWFAVLLISAGFVCAVWAVAPGGGPVGPQRPTARDCEVAQSLCAARCKNKYGNLWDWATPCYRQCGADYADCISAIKRANVGAGATGQTPPPNATGPNPTPAPTPRRHPIKGPPHKLGPSPTPSPNPILLAKPAKPTPSPKPTPKKSSHSHHS